ncbi:hypothetical protein D3C80_545810 [compost metagenome]
MSSGKRKAIYCNFNCQAVSSIQNVSYIRLELGAMHDMTNIGASDYFTIAHRWKSAIEWYISPTRKSDTQNSYICGNMTCCKNTYRRFISGELFGQRNSSAK